MRLPMPSFARKAGRFSGIALAFVVALAACSDDGRRPTDAVEGTWVIATDTVDAVYLRITADSIFEYTEDGIAGCYDLRGYAIVDVDGDRFSLEEGERELTVLLRRDDDALIVEAFDQSQRYEPSSLDPGTLALCEPTNPNADCETLPPLPMGQDIEGTIEGSDEVNPDGSHYDLYRVSMEAPASVQVDMRSTDVDSYLVLFDSAGVFVEDNDDASTLTLNARVAPSLVAGCYIVMATTSFPDELGDYQLSLTTPD